MGTVTLIWAQQACNHAYSTEFNLRRLNLKVQSKELEYYSEIN